jgi:ERF superfamily
MTELAEQGVAAAEVAFATALAIVQSAMPRVGKDKSASIRSDKGSYTYKYSDLAAVLDAVSPVAAAQGFSFMSIPTLSHGGAFVLRYFLWHNAGHREGGEYPLPDPGRSTPQQVGSHITYARRYVYCAMLGVAADEDDDGRAGAAPSSRPIGRTSPVVDGSAASLQVPPAMGPDIVDTTTGELSSGTPMTVPDAWDAPLRPRGNHACTPEQQKAMGAAYTNAGIKDRSARLADVARIVRHDVTSAKELTVAEASHVIDDVKGRVKA